MKNNNENYLSTSKIFNSRIMTTSQANKINSLEECLKPDTDTLISHWKFDKIGMKFRPD